MCNLFNLYRCDKGDKSRFVLGKDGDKKVYVIGLNPSTADREESDQTITRVKEIVSRSDEYDGFVMVNLYPLRSTDPTQLPHIPDKALFDQNIEIIRKLVSSETSPIFWAAWGDDITIRSYLVESFKALRGIVTEFNGRWLHYGELTKDQNPRHPSRAGYDWLFSDFDAKTYTPIRTHKDVTLPDDSLLKVKERKHGKGQASLEYAEDAFNSILGLEGKKFGVNNIRGFSDAAEGVQWNIAVDTESGEVLLGVNLEGMKYTNWPITTFIESELEQNLLPSLIRNSTDAEKIHIGIYRDAWQVQHRPPIDEQFIRGSDITLKDLTEDIWKEMLNEAYDCLNADKGRRGRAFQVVTPTNKTEKTMQVSPHLTITTRAWGLPPSNENDAISKLEGAFKRLQPVYEFVTKQSRDMSSG